MPDSNHESLEATIARAAADPALLARRLELSHVTARAFADVGRRLHVAGHLVGGDRVAGRSPWGHGSDEVVAASVLFRIGAQLISASADLFADGRAYAAAALTRQLVEVEYLAWAFDVRDGDGERWLRSTREERQAFFSPAKIRAAADDRFRGKDYWHHCELGGHPVPRATTLLVEGDHTIPQMLLCDMLGHAGHIWDHLQDWAHDAGLSELMTPYASSVPNSFREWKAHDPLADLPPPPSE